MLYFPQIQHAFFFISCHSRHPSPYLFLHNHIFKEAINFHNTGLQIKIGDAKVGGGEIHSGGYTPVAYYRIKIENQQDTNLLMPILLRLFQRSI